MKQGLLILFALGWNLSVFADGSRIDIYSITYETGSGFDTVYCSVPSYIGHGIEDKDSLSAIVIEFVHHGWDSAMVYQELLHITVQNPWRDKTAPLALYELRHPKRLAGNVFTRAELTKVATTVGAYGIASTVYPSDAAWIEQAPDTIYRFNDNYCDYYIYLYDNNEVLTGIAENIGAIISAEDSEESYQQVADFIKQQGRKRWLVVTICTC